MCGTPRDRFPRGRFWTFGEYHIFFLKNQILFHTFAQAWRKGVKRYLSVFGLFRPIGGYFIFAEKNNILFINWAWYFALGTRPSEYCTNVGSWVSECNIILKINELFWRKQYIEIIFQNPNKWPYFPKVIFCL